MTTTTDNKTPLPPRHGCTRWRGQWPQVQRSNQEAIKQAIAAGHWCNSIDDLHQYQVGPLCQEHAP